MVLLKKTDYNNKIAEIEGKIPHISNLATKTALTTVENKIPNISNLTTKILVNKVENRIPDISNFATKTPLTTVENKIPNLSGLATKTELNTVENKVPDISNLAAKTASTTVENKIPDISSLVKKSDYNTKITEVENNIKRLQTYDLGYFRGKKCFDEEDGKQNYLVFLPKIRYFKLNSVINVIDCDLSWQSKGISNESIKQPTTSDNSLNPELSYYGTKTRVKIYRKFFKTAKFYVYS